MDVPFRVGEQVTGEWFTDRAPEVSRIRAAMRSPTRLLVYGERRLGKSSAIRQAGERAARDGVVVAWVDVSTIAGFGELADRLVPSIPYRWRWREAFQERLLGLGLRVELGTDAVGHPVLGLSPTRGRPSAAEEKARFRSAVEALDGAAGAGGARVAVVLDEFQEVDRVLDRGSATLRDVMQRTSSLSWVCAGSKLSLIEELIGREGPYYRFFEPLAMGPIEPGHLSRWIESRMAATGLEVERGVGVAILELAGPRTQDCLQLARAVFQGAAGERATLESVAAAFERSVLEDGDRFATYWQGLADSHRRLLRAIAAGEDHLTGADVRDRYGLPSSAAVTKAIATLRSNRFLASSGPPAIDDPFFRGWILLRAMPDGLPGDMGRTGGPSRH